MIRPSETHVGLPQPGEFSMTETEALRMEVRQLRAEVTRLNAALAALAARHG